MRQSGPEPVGGVAHRIRGENVCSGSASGEILWLAEPLSFWGGTNLETGVITDVHHLQHGVSLAGRVVAMAASRGSSSSSSVLAEQLRSGVGPAAIVLSSRDAIVALGVLVAREVYDIRMPLVLVSDEERNAIPRSGPVAVTANDSGPLVSWYA
jgi:predicted aconitase with swiveling domain